MVWSRLLSHATYNDTYVASGIKGKFLIVSYNTNFSHATPPETTAVTEIELAVLRIDTGEGLLDNCKNAFTMSSGYIKGLDMVSTGETGIYVLAEIKAGNLKYVKDDPTTYTFDNKGLALILLNLDEATVPTAPSLNLVSIEYIYPPNQFPPTRIFPFFSSGVDGYGVPDILFVSHLNEAKRTGLIYYGFSTITCPATSTVPANYNPFASATDCLPSCSCCLSTNPAICLQCNDTSPAERYYLANSMTCTKDSCPEGYYLSDKLCLPCHYSCKTCTGPLINHCVLCNTGRDINFVTNECVCNFASNKFTLNGACIAICNLAQFGYTSDYTCRDSCPAHTFHYVNYGANTNALKTSDSIVDEGNDALEFSPSTPACLSLPGPRRMTTIPDQFTISLWVQRKSDWSNSNRALIWAFNSFAINVATSSSSVHGVRFMLKSSSGSTYTVPDPLTTTNTNLQTSGIWYYISASVRKTLTGIDMILYVSPNGGTSAAERKTILTSFSWPTYTNFILLGCDATLDSATGLPVSIPSLGFDMYVRDLMYQSTFYEKASLEDNMARAFSTDSLIYKRILSHWKFGSISSTASDSSPDHLTATLPANPTKSVSTISFIVKKKWDNPGQCIELFSNDLFASVSASVANYAVNGLEFKINTYDQSVLLNIISNQDHIKFYRGGCGQGTLLQTVKVYFEGGVMRVERNKPIPITAYGTHVDICYFSSTLGVTVKLGQVYFLDPPKHVFPSHGSSDTTLPSLLNFDLQGGDMTFQDIVTFHMVDTNVTLAQEDAILIDEAAEMYPTYTIERSGTTHFSALAPEKLDPGTYTLLWRPPSLTLRGAKNLIEYKNLYVTWAIQTPPSVMFEALDDGMSQNGVTFKAEFAYLNIVGRGQADGDQLLFCVGGCHYNLRRGEPYTRVNGKYPAIWLGESFGVTGLITNPDNDRLYICWRPSATASYLSPGEDTWAIVKEATEKASKGFVRINALLDNRDLPELEDIFPPITNPVLHKGESIYFKISKCGEMKTRPTRYLSTPGKVQVVHLLYTSANLTTYATEVIWEEVFTEYPTGDDGGFTAGKLFGDPITCQYNLTGLTESSFINGDTYRLIIYSRSFISTSYSRYFLGELDPGLPQLQYEFTYQEVDYDTTTQIIIPSQTDIVIPASHISTITTPERTINGVTIPSIIKRLFGVKVSLFTTPTCTSGDPGASYTSLSYRSNELNALKFEDVRLHGCNGTLSAKIQILRLVEVDTTPVWTYSSSTIEIGPIKCDSSCATCDGPTKYDCTSCSEKKFYQYLYKGQCMSRCEIDQPFTFPIYTEGTVIINHYICMASCPLGYFWDSFNRICSKCNDPCRTCTSDLSMSCLSCQSYTPTINGTVNSTTAYYVEKYFFKQICVVNCPVITNDISVIHENMVITDLYNHNCDLYGVPSGKSPVTVSIQPIAYKHKLNVQNNARLRALVDDPTHNLAGFKWQAHPTESLSTPGFMTSDDRTFLSYDPEYLNKTIVGLNMNTFNNKNNGDDKQVIVKARTNDSLAIGIMELYSNLAVDFKKAIIRVRDNATLKTMTLMSISMDGVDDPDDSLKTIKFRIGLKVTALSVSKDEVPLDIYDTVMASTDVPDRMITISASAYQTVVDSKLDLNNIYIPPLMNGPILIESFKVANLSCELTIIAEDRFQAVAVAREVVNITESYTTSQRNTVIRLLYNETVKARNNYSFSWDIALRIANTFDAVIPPQKEYYMSYSKCSRDIHCGYGICINMAGRGICQCNLGYTGSNCEWSKNEFQMLKTTVYDTIKFANSTLIDPISELILTNQDYYSDDISVSVQLANVLGGILINPELCEFDLMPSILRLCDYMTRVSIHACLRMDDDEKNLILKGVDRVVKYVLYHLRDAMYSYLILNDKKNLSKEYEYELSNAKVVLSGYVMTVRSCLYRFLNSISVAQFPDDSPFMKSYETFEVLIFSSLKESLFSSLGDNYGLTLTGNSTFIKIPKTFLDSVGNIISETEDFMIRAVTWFESPYLFSNSHPEMLTPVQSVALLNSNGTELTLNLTEPIVIFLPLSNLSKNTQNEAVICKCLNESVLTNVTLKKDTRSLYRSAFMAAATTPYKASDTILLDDYEYYNVNVSLPEFVNDESISSYGAIMKVNDYIHFIPCAVFKTGEVAAVVSKRKSKDVEIMKTGFYNQFEPLSYWRGTLGFYSCMAMAGLFGLTYLLVMTMDKVLIPKLEKLIEINRMDYAQNDIELNQIEKDKFSFDTIMPQQQLIKEKDKGKGQAHKDREIESDDSGDENPKPKINIKDDDLAYRKGSNIQDQSIKIDSMKIDKGDVSDYSQVMGDTLKPKELGVVNNSMQTQEVTTTVAMRTNAAVTGMDDDNPDKLFSDIKAAEIRKKEKQDHKVKDIFSDEHIEKREEELNTFKQLWIYGNPFVNLASVTNTTLMRTTRCITTFLNVYFQMFWCAVFISSTQTPLDQPEDLKKVTDMVGEQMWIPFSSSMFTLILLYFFCGLFKVSDNRVLTTKTFAQYKKLL